MQITTKPGGGSGGKNFLIGTLANILAASPGSYLAAFATDTGYFYVSDGTNWQESAVALIPRTLPDRGAYPDSSQQGYYADMLTDKILNNCLLRESDREEEGSIRTTIGGELQIYLNGAWNSIIYSFRFAEPETGEYTLQFQPVGYTYWVDVNSGNSDIVGLNGVPLVKNWMMNMGCYGSDMILDGGTF